MKKWTVSQREAINQRDRDLLVSASAGSGKTSVMIERIASMIEGGVANIDEILVLTFTNASATDMRLKLNKRLGKIVAACAMDTAFIGTFHKFCGELVRTYFNIAEVSPDFEILDESTAGAIKSEILNNIIVQNYDRLNVVIDTFCVNRKTDMLKEMLLSIYNFLMSRENPIEWLEETAYASYDSDFAMGKIIEHYRMIGGYYRSKFDELHGKVAETDKVTPYIVECIDIATRIGGVSCYEDLNKIALSVEYTRLNPSAGKDFADYGYFKELRDRLKKITDKVKDHYLVSHAQMQRNQATDRKIVEGVVELVTAFITEYSAEKLRQNKLDFNDLEKYACVVLDNGEVVSTVKQKYKYIFVDEYQDTNPMQERILSRVASERNIFMVGDVKQSIYGFRGCEATIFAGRMTHYERELSGLVVKLNENFRSAPEILAFANLVFGKIMRGSVADIDYNTTSRFEVKGLSGDAKVDVVLLNASKGTAVRKQAAIIAQKIGELLKQGVSLSDIAILSRSRNSFGELASVLHSAGIDVSVDADVPASDLFEINLIENMLYAVSNFYNDVPLVMLMSSSVFGFTADELAEIKLNAEKNEPFYKAMMRVGGEKIEKFSAFLDKYRVLAKEMSVVDLISVFLAEYKVIERFLILPRGEDMVANIYSYLDVLRNASWASSVSGYLYLLENELLEVKIKQTGNKKDCVQIMTMHASKGLEFPVVFVYDVGATFNVSDTRRLMVVDKNCGLCVYSLDADEFYKTHSIARHSAVIALNNVTIAEEMRLLYVALTRAKQRLFIVGGGNINAMNRGCEDYDILSAKNHLQFLAPALFSGEGCFDLRIIDADDVVVEEREQSVRVLSGKCDQNLVEQLREIYAKPYAYQTATQTRAKTSVSELLRGDEVRPVASGGEKGKGKEFGTAYHKQMQWLSVGEIEKIIPIVQGAEIYRELAFLQTVGDSIVQGVIDLVAIRGDTAIVIDYKTTNASEKRLVELYSRQLQMYASAVESALPGIKEVKCYIYSLVYEKLIEVEV